MHNNEQLSFISYLKFITRRVFRIFPAFIFTLVVSFIVLQFIGTRPSTWLDKFWTSTPGFLTLIKQSLLIVRIPNDPLLRIIPQDWTLSIEIAISFLLPALAVTLKKRPYMVLFFVYFAVQFLGLDGFIFDFSLGVYLACNKDELSVKWNQSRNKIYIILFAIIIICIDYLAPVMMKYSDIILIHHKIWGLAIILWAIISSSIIQKLLSIWPLTFLGKISYSFYLLHFIILLCMTVLFSTLNPLSFLLLYLGITVVMSTITYFLVEKPFNNKAKTFFNK